MKLRTIRRLLLGLFAVSGALIAAMVVLVYFVDVNLYRDQIERQASAALGRQVVLEGPLGLEPSLAPRLTIEGLKVGNPVWASRPFLATVREFDIRVRLLPLLRGDLEIIRFEFHGVDLLLEEAADGNNNFTFGGSGEPASLPTIRKMLLTDVSVTYAASGIPARHLHLDEVTAKKLPGQVLELDASTTVNRLPLTISLRSEPGDVAQPDSPWNFTLLGESGDTSLQAEGSIAGPFAWHKGEYRLQLSGQHLDKLETLTDIPLPAAGPYELSAIIRHNLNEYLEVNELTANLDESHISGNFNWNMLTSTPSIQLRLDSEQFDMRILDDFESKPVDADEALPGYWEYPLATSAAVAIDLDAEVRIQRLEGLQEPLRDIVLTAQTDRERLKLEIDRATVMDTQITANTTLPWGQQLQALAPQTVSLATLLQHAELDLRAAAPTAIYRYDTNLMGEPHAIKLTDVELAARPNHALVVRARATLDDEPVSLKLQAESLATLLQQPDGPWPSLVLELRSDVIQLDASGSVAQPLEAKGFDVRYSSSGPEIGALLPLQGAWSLAGHYTEHMGRHLFDELKVILGGSDIAGRIEFQQDNPRPRLLLNLDVGKLHVDDLRPDTAGETSAAALLDQPLEIGEAAAIDLDAEVRIQRLEGLQEPLRDIVLTAQCNALDLTMSPLQATLDGVRLDARAQLPWGERLASLVQADISARQLARYADLYLQAEASSGDLDYEVNFLGQPEDLELAGLEITARPDESVRLSTRVEIAEKSLQVKMQTEPLADLLKNPSGPWKGLAATIQGSDILIEASGSVEQPFDARGFDINYSVRGDEIDTLLPLFDLVLPLEGAYSLTGHFADLPDRIVFDELKIASGKSDISGTISIYPGTDRPRAIARLNSEQIYLGEFLPDNESEATRDTEARVIPDYNLPVEQMREIDAELHFEGKRLRTPKGDLGDIRFTATLQDAVFRLDPFQVRGWKGALIEFDTTIDASKDSPEIAMQLVARDLDYGLLLEQAGMAETVEGTLDISFRLSGNGRTRYQLLGDAHGHLVIVGKEGRFGSRMLDLWAADLVTTMLSREWRSEDFTDLNCLVARVRIEDGIASSDNLLVDTRRITVGAAGTLDLENEALNLVFTPRPKRTSLVSLSSPVQITGTIAAPEVNVTVLPSSRIVAAGGGLLAGLFSPRALLLLFSRIGSGEDNACVTAVEEARAMKAESNELEPSPEKAP